MPSIARDDPAAAGQVMCRTCPDPRLRRFLMAQLLRSIAVADQAGPRSWAVTLFARGFRLNVGQVEALTWLDGVAGCFLLGAVPPAAYAAGEVLERSFRSLPPPQHVLYTGAAELQGLHRRLRPAHEAFLRAAAVSASGTPRRCAYARYHSPGLYRYALDL